MALKPGYKSWLLLCCPLLLFLTAARAQEVVDKTVVVVRDSGRSELITYSDLLWQLALQPGVQLDPIRTEDLNQALQTVIDQRLFALEARRLPRSAPSDKEIADKIAETVSHFPSPAAFEARLKRVGFDSIKDPAFESLIAQRLSIDKYIEFRFRSFVVVTADEETKYYRDVFVPEFRRRSPGLLVPMLEERRAYIHDALVELKVGTAIERFLEEVRGRVEIEKLLDV